MSMTQSVPPPPDVGETLRQYQSLGLAVIPIWGVTTKGVCQCPDGPNCNRSKGKHPASPLAPNGSKNASTDAGVLKDWLNRNPDGNWAIATGLPLTSGGYLVVLDIDPRNDGDRTLADLLQSHGGLPVTVEAKSGGGGNHYYFRSMAPVQGRTVGPGIDLKGTGGYVLAAPSNHESGGRYEWVIAPGDIDIADAPPWLLEGAEQGRARPVWAGTSAKDTHLGAAFEAAGWLGMPLPNGKYAVKCPWHHEHSDGRGDGLDDSTVILPPIPGTTFGSFVCLHSHCNNVRKWDDVLKALPPSALLSARATFPLKPQPVAAPPAGVPAKVRVFDLLATKVDKQGNVTVIADLPNLVCVLTYDDRWLYNGKPILVFDEFAGRIAFTTTPPWHPDDAPEFPIQHWTDEDVYRLISFTKRFFNFNVSAEQAYAAARMVAKRNGIHPVRTYLQNLEWDGVPRVDTWLSRYLGVESTDYSRRVGRWWLIAAVARVMVTGVKADNVLILEGKQGLRKSSALSTLAVMPDWFSDTPFETGSKDAYMGLRGKWIVELAELDSFSRSESSRNKAFFSAVYDTFRPPYGRETQQVARQCVFAGSVNPGDTPYFKDETGNRRYWPVACGNIALERLQQDRDQLWAEAVTLYNSREKWYPETEEERGLCEVEQYAREDHDDPWLGFVSKWLDSQQCENILKSREPGGWVTTSCILTHALDVPKERITRRDAMRIGQVMKCVPGWAKHQIGRKDFHGWGWRKVP